MGVSLQSVHHAMLQKFHINLAVRLVRQIHPVVAFLGRQLVVVVVFQKVRGSLAVNHACLSVARAFHDASQRQFVTNVIFRQRLVDRPHGWWVLQRPVGTRYDNAAFCSVVISTWSAIGMILFSVCLSICLCLWHCALWLNDTSYNKQTCLNKWIGSAL